MDSYYRRTVVEANLANCENEKINIPGAIQPFGILVCVNPSDFCIEHISQNVTAFLGRLPESLLGKPLSYLITAKDFETLSLSISRDKNSVPEKYLLELKKGDGLTEVWLAIVHRQEKYLIFELEQRSANLNRDMSFLNQVENSIAEIQEARSLKNLCNITAREVQRITGYDRVMIYRFSPNWNGEVIAEARSTSGIDSYLSHHFPASDIPAQAREVFLANWIRMIPDVNYVPAALVANHGEKKHEPVDLSRSFLRSVSPLHIQYLKNMGVAATLTISLIQNEKLWGLIACHHHEPKNLSPQMRSACKFIGKLVSSQFGLKEEVEDFQYKSRLDTVLASLKDFMRREDDVVKGLVNYSPNLNDLTHSTGAAIANSRGNDGWTVTGKTPTLAQIARLSEWLADQVPKTSNGVFFTENLEAFFPEARDYSNVASGLLAVAIPKTDRSFILWFRHEVLQVVTWAGNPEKLVEKLADGSVKIEPRASFESWKQTVKYHSLPWRNAETKAALELKFAIFTVDLAHQFRDEQKARATAERLTREKEDILAMVSHDLKNPLTAIELSIQVFDRKLQRQQVDETDKNLPIQELKLLHEKITDATSRMQRMIHDLLDVAKIEDNSFALHPKILDVGNFLVEAAATLQSLTLKKNIRLEVKSLSEACLLSFDEDRLFQVLSNLVSNAVKFSNKDGVVVIKLEHCDPEIVISVKDNGRGISEEHLPHVFDRFWQVRETSSLGTGLGLTICKGIVTAHGGKIWIKSALNSGTTVSFSLPKTLEPC